MSNDKEHIWSIPRIWPDSVVFIIGGGPSLNQQDLSLIHDQRVIGVNQAYELGQWVDVCWYGDRSWYRQNIHTDPSILDFRGLIVTCSKPVNNNYLGFIKYVKRGPMEGLQLEKRTHVGWNRNSGASAISLAYWLGASIVVLLGFDMQQSEKNMPTHWHSRYPHKKNKDGTYANPYPNFMKCWPAVKRDASKVGLRIINATVGGALDIFERMPLEEVCQKLCR